MDRRHHDRQPTHRDCGESKPDHTFDEPCQQEHRCNEGEVGSAMTPTLIHRAATRNMEVSKLGHGSAEGSTVATCVSIWST